jgi:hypothetical protein
LNIHAAAMGRAWAQGVGGFPVAALLKKKSNAARSLLAKRSASKKFTIVSFMDHDLGYFDLETRVLEPLENPFGPKVLPM